ncbi:chromatin assembly factor 1 subunit A-like [Helianthus annuus]|uniref:chromatin assembly factor 1 subunit A-like n=1 Tax=Helianthus annuus TaxID=4232 RepID=UPI001653247F|nr:chromatin assembly factor 1 subunit A-like [Helianthus annuus]
MDDEPIPWKDDRTEEQKYQYRKLIAETKIIRLSGVYLEARRANRWDPDRNCYLDRYGNVAIDDKTLDVEAIIQEYKEDDEYWQHKWWGTPTSKMIEEEKEKERKEKEEKERKEMEEKKMNGKCSNCEKSEADSVKLLKDVESLTLENNSLKIKKKADNEQILELCLNYEKIKSENDKLLVVRVTWKHGGFGLGSVHSASARVHQK